MMTDRFTYKGRILYSDIDVISATTEITLTQLQGIQPRINSVTSDLHVFKAALNAIRTTLEGQSSKTWWNKKHSASGMVLHVSAEEELDVSDASLLEIQGIQLQITTMSNSITTLNLFNGFNNT